MKKQVLIAMSFLLVLGACKKDENDPADPSTSNEEELITTVTVHAHEMGNMDNHSMASFRDTDGAGGNDATIDTLKLDTNTTYMVTMELLDESGSTAEDITAEVKEEDDEHIFCFEPGNSDISVTITDNDGTHPVGVESEWVTTSAGTTSVKITLKHQPNGEKDGTCAPGETDVEVTFPVVVQ